MLLRQQEIDAVEVIAVTGPVGDGDSDELSCALTSALDARPRGVLLDLSEAGPLPPTAVQVLAAARRAAPGWPHPALVVCCSAKEMTTALAAASLLVHPRAEVGLAHVDDRSAAPRARFGLDHGSMLAPAAAREAAAAALVGFGLQPLADDVALVVSELVTNAVRYARPPVEVEIEVGEQVVTVAVGDGSPGSLAPRTVDADAEGGRGLQLVDLVAAEMGVRPQPPGKTVWAQLPRP